MEGRDLDKVKALKSQYEAAGVVTISSYRFLDSIVHAGILPRVRVSGSFGIIMKLGNIAQEE